ncbi:MAG: dihydroorotate dehydrogenase catalytic subunit, partial [Gaiellales bacterium]|nr:dihydroorotate dehydrogenase catalytic subunit [Gaiellales bacterium]
AVELEHQLLNASGTLDALAAAGAGVPVHQDVAALVTKTITPLPREGNPAPRLAESPSGLLNSIGLANPGVDEFARGLPALVALGRPLVVSIGGFSVDDYVGLARALAEAPGVVALELNISCPNVETGCSSIGSDAAETAAVVRACRAVTSRPLWVKLSPNVADVAVIGRAAELEGADALVCVNTLRGMAIEAWSGRPLLGAGTGGLSGPALKPVALAAVWTCASACSLPIVGAGGVLYGRDALDLLDAGAAAVQVGTALFRHPRAVARIHDELQALVENR